MCFVPYGDQSKRDCKDQESIQSSTTPDQVHHTGENDKGTRKHHIQESQEVSPFPTANHKAAIDRLH